MFLNAVNLLLLCSSAYSFASPSNINKGVRALFLYSQRAGFFCFAAAVSKFCNWLRKNSKRVRPLCIRVCLCAANGVERDNNDCYFSKKQRFRPPILYLHCTGRRSFFPCLTVQDYWQQRVFPAIFPEIKNPYLCFRRNIRCFNYICIFYFSL